MIADGWRTRTAATLAFMVRDLTPTLKAGPDQNSQAAKLVADAMGPASRGVRVGRTPNIRNANDTAERYGARADRLAGQLARGTLSPDAFAREMAKLIARSTTEQFMNGRGQTQLTADQRRFLERKVADQLSFLNGFRQEAGARLATLQTPEERAKMAAAFQRRARMYIDSATSAWWTGRTFDLNLPAQPKDGGTDCLSNCLCSWRIEEVDTSKGWFDCYWQLADAEHCDGCVRRAAEYAPYRVRPKAERKRR